MTKVALGVLAAMVCSFSIQPNAFAQNTHAVTLRVNTAEIQNVRKKDAYQYCTFLNQPENTDPRDYTIYVDPGDVIKWGGISTSDRSHRIQVVSINYKGGDNVFDKNVLKETRETPNEVLGVVQRGTEGFIEKYTIFFRIYINDRPLPGMYQVDPKVSVNRSR